MRTAFAAGAPLLTAARELGVGIESICGGTVQKISAALLLVAGVKFIAAV